MNDKSRSADAILADLRALVGEERVLCDARSREEFGQDWLRFYEPDPLAILFPETPEEVQSIVRLACRDGVPVVPSGGRTGLSGGATARHGELILSLARMNRILGFDEVDRTVTCQAGVITARLQEFAREKRLFYPVDFASAGSSQIGGNIATNAGGIKVVRYGLTRDRVAGLKVVTGTGELLELNRGLVKNATGYDLRHLFIGSEGTLGIIVEATLRLTDAPRDPQVMLLAVPDMTQLVSILVSFREEITLEAFEFFSDQALAHVLARGGMEPPFAAASPYYALLEYDRVTEVQSERALAVFERLLADGRVTDGVISASGSQVRELWRYRENISEAITPRTPYKNDISVVTSRIPAFLAEVETEVKQRYPEFELIWFGHVADGNVHLNILRPEAMDVEAFKRECDAITPRIYEIVARHGGSVSAEHGVGLLKRDYLHFTRSAGELRLMAALKRLFDPAGIMNPGKLIS